MMIPARTVIAVFVVTTFLSVPCFAAGAGENPILKDVFTRLNVLADRIEKLDQRILRLERMLVKPPIRVDENGIIRDDQGRPVGIWGIDAQPTLETAVPPNR